jgi:tetrapyrrole methylase family protein/MazG family protein
LAEKEGRFTLEDALRHIVAKLIRRHPHIFGEGRLKTSEEVLKQWDQIKQVEKKGQRHSVLDGIPKDLPALARAQKVAKKFAKLHFTPQAEKETFSPEEQVGEVLWKSVQELSQQGIEAEQALRKRLIHIEAEFRKWEQQQEETTYTISGK